MWRNRSVELLNLQGDDGGSPVRDRLATSAREFAERGVYLGTSSWKYPGWCGQLYSEQRYIYRNKFSETRFNRACLEEYAQTFSSVCVDAGYYQFPTEKYVKGLCDQTPEEFKFSFKVTDEITIKHFPKLPRFGKRAGQDNPNFLNANLFISQFLAPMEPFREKIGVLILEFSQFYQRDFERGRDFVAALDEFLSQLPGGWQYGVEIRNKFFLKPYYFETLARHGVAHVYNNWSRMPTIGEQMRMENSLTTDFTVARFLLTPGRKYQDAVDLFSPYQETMEIDEEARQAGRDLLRQAAGADQKGDPQNSRAVGRPSYIYVNNRLEGNAPNTILAMVEGEGEGEENG